MRFLEPSGKEQLSWYLDIPLLSLYKEAGLYNGVGTYYPVTLLDNEYQDKYYEAMDLIDKGSKLRGRVNFKPYFDKANILLQDVYDAIIEYSKKHPLAKGRAHKRPNPRITDDLKLRKLVGKAVEIRHADLDKIKGVKFVIKGILRVKNNKFYIDGITDKIEFYARNINSIKGNKLYLK